MFNRLSNFLERVQSIEENPFWAMQRQRSARTYPLKALWRGYAGYALLFMLPLGLLSWFSLSEAHFSRASGRQELAALLAFGGVCQLLYLSVKAALSTSPSVVQARQQGTLLALALTRINSADFADGVALSEARTIALEFLVWIPAVAIFTLATGLSLYSTLLLTLISAACILYFAYHGVLISATSKDTQEAGRRASQGTFLSLAGLSLGFLFGGFMLGPLWLLHPVFAYLCATWGAGSPYGPQLQFGEMSMLFWSGWSLFVLPIYLWMILSVRQSAIRALERVRIA